MESQTDNLLKILHQGGNYAYWWTLEGQATTWWKAGKPSQLPEGRKNIYVGVHPTTMIPKTNVRGEQRPARSLRAQLPIIAALNCLYTELDAKDFDNDKEKARAAVDAITPQPSVLIDSGGGYHLYWLLDETWILESDEEREQAKRVQAAWVSYAGGDPAAKDLARVLRVPGTWNFKYEPPRKVTYIYADFNRRYARLDLQAKCAHLIADDRLPSAEAADRTEPVDREQRYARTALDREVAAVLRAPNGLKHDQIRNTAIKLGSMVAAGWLSEQEVITDITRAADAHRADTKDTARTILDGLAYGKQRRHAALPPTQQRPATLDTRTAVVHGSESIDALPILIKATELHRIPPAIALIRDVLFVNTLHQFFGAPGSAKSFLLLDIACTVAQRYPVVYVAAEAIEDYEARVNAWSAHYGKQVENLYFWRQPLHLGDPVSVQQFTAAISNIGPALCVFDPLSDCMTGLDENSASDMGIAIGALNAIRRESHAAVAIVHHTGWNDEHERGHSKLRGACRIVVKIEMRDDGQIRFTCVKKNQGMKFTPRLFRLVASGDMDGVLPLPAHLVLRGKTKPTDRMLKTMEALTTEPLRKGATHTQLMQDTQIPAGTLNRVLTVLTESGFIKSWEKGRATYYELTNDGEDALAIAAAEGSQEVEDKVEDSGRTYSWVVLSSTVTGLQEAILPNVYNVSSNGTQPTPPSPPLKGERGEAGPEISPPRVFLPPAENRVPVGYGGNALAETQEIAVLEHTPVVFKSELDWDYLRTVYASQNVAAIRSHCAMRRVDANAVLEQLFAEASPDGELFDDED